MKELQQKKTILMIFIRRTLLVLRGTYVGKYSEEDNQIILTGSNASKTNAIVLTETVIATFDVKVKVDLTVGDVVATQTIVFFVDEDEVIFAENERREGVVTYG